MEQILTHKRREAAKIAGVSVATIDREIHDGRLRAVKVGRATLINAVEAVATLVFCAVGLEWGGLPGACLGCLLAYAMIAAYSFAVAVLRYRLMVPVGATCRFLVASLIMAAAIRLQVFPPAWLGLALRIALGLLTYSALSFVLWRPVLPRPMPRWR